VVIARVGNTRDAVSASPDFERTQLEAAPDSLAQQTGFDPPVQLLAAFPFPWCGNPRSSANVRMPIGEDSLIRSPTSAANTRRQSAHRAGMTSWRRWPHQHREARPSQDRRALPTRRVLEPRAPQSESVRLGHVQPNILFHRNPPSDFAASPDLPRGLNLRRPAMTTAQPVYLQQRKIFANGRHRRSVPKSGSFMRAEPRGMAVGPF
jgi:hypothetical protein